MIEKEYYRVDELQSRFGMSFRDIRNFVESSQVPLAFYIEQNKFIIGGRKIDKGFSGFGSVSYRGLVNISASEQLKIIGNEKVKVNTFSLLNKKMISVYNLEYPFESTLPNSFLYSWEPRPLEHISWDSIPAKLFPKEQEDSRRVLGNGFKDLFSAITGKEPVVSEKVSQALNKIPKKEFYSAGIELSIDDVCLLHTDIVRLGLYQSSLSTLVQQTKQPEELKQTKNNKPSDESTSRNLPIDTLVLRHKHAPKKRRDGINEMLIEMIKDKPHYQNKEYFRLFESEASTEQGLRVYDKHNLLVSIETDLTTHWQSINGKPRKPFKFEAFKNRVSEMRKVVFPKD